MRSQKKFTAEEVAEILNREEPTSPRFDTAEIVDIETEYGRRQALQLRPLGDEYPNSCDILEFDVLFPDGSKFFKIKTYAHTDKSWANVEVLIDLDKQYFDGVYGRETDTKIRGGFYVSRVIGNMISATIRQKAVSNDRAEDSASTEAGERPTVDLAEESQA